MSDGLIGPLEIRSLAFGGNGVARHAGRVVFVHGAVPGDHVRVRLVREKKRYAEAEAVDFAAYAEQRRSPYCPYFGDCGGCQWQMLPYAEQLKHKEQIFQDILRRHSQVDEVLISPILESPTEWHYRSRVQFKCQQRKNGELAIGFYRHGSHSVVDVASCPIAATEFNDLLPILRDLLRSCSCSAAISQLDMEIGDDHQLRLVVHYAGSSPQKLADCLWPLQQARAFALFLNSGSKKALHHLGGPEEISLQVDTPPIQLAYAAGGFAQINLAQNRQMVKTALAMSAPHPDWRVLDLYSGMGNFSLPFARRVDQLVAVESYQASVAQGKVNAERNGIENIHFGLSPASGTCRKYRTDRGFDLVILDPPRAGAKEVVA